MAIIDKLRKKKKDKEKKAKKTKQEPINKKNLSQYGKILIAPIITEKTTILNKKNKYVFKVSKKANKNQIKKATQAVFKVKPTKINIIRKQGKKINFNRITGKRKNQKFAIITLKKDDKINIYEGT